MYIDFQFIVTAKISNHSNSTSYAYNGIGQRTSATDANGTFTYAYDNRDRLTREVKHDGSELLYGYDAAGNRTTLSTVVAGATSTATYTFDALNRMQSVTDGNGNTTSYEFDANSNQTRIDHANGTATTMAFDELNRVTTITHLGTAGETLTSLDYTLDATGRRTAITESAGRSSNYTYDALYRLTGETIADTEAGNHSASFRYDAVSNRIADTVNGVSSTYTYDDNDRLISHGFNAYSYDDNGNTVIEVADGQSNSYSYDSQNRLTEANMGGVVQSMAYDPDGIRIQKSLGGETTEYLTDTNRDYAQVLYERSATSELNYTFGTDLVGLDTGAEQFTYHTDALGSTRLLTNDAGSVADDVRYDAWGEVLAGGDVGENQYLYTGEQFDSGLGKTYLRARYYDAGVGRFSQMDVFEGFSNNAITQNKYAYSNLDPSNVTDPSGYFGLVSFSISNSVKTALALTASTTILIGSSSESLDTGHAREYDQNSLLYHYYEMENFICFISTPKCSIENVFYQLRRFPAPGADPATPVNSGDITSIEFLAISGGRVVHLFKDDQTIRNQTLDDHVFRDGYVDRKVVVDGGRLKIETVGEGISRNLGWKLLNIVSYRPAFNIADSNIKHNVR